MNREIREQVDYLEKRIAELVRFCQAEVQSDDVSSNVKNVAQDILAREKRLLDNLMYWYFEEKITPTLSQKDLEKYSDKVYFPIIPKREDLEPFLGKFGLADLNIRNEKLFSVIERYQPYNPGQEWIRQLRDYSNLGHKKLIPQSKIKDTNFLVGNAIKISGKAGVLMRDVSVNGLLVKELRVEKGVLSGQVDPRLNIEAKTMVNYVIDGTTINVILLCTKSLNEIRTIAKEFSTNLN